jgi:DNA-binding transcriptional regulator YiaG
MGAVKDTTRALVQFLEARTRQTTARGKFPAPWFSAGGRRPVDHGARKRAAEWRAYQATWQTPIDQLECSAQRFYTLRRNVLGLNRKQTARLLRVGVQSVLNWESGTHPVPFYAFLSLFLISESQHYRLANEAWRDWEFKQRYDPDPRIRKHVTYIVNRKTGAAFTPEDLNRFDHQMARLAALESENLNAVADAITSKVPGTGNRPPPRGRKP